MSTMTVTAVAPTGMPYTFTFSDMGNFTSAGSAWTNPAAAEALQMLFQIDSMEDGSFTKSLLWQWLHFNSKGRQSIPIIMERFARMETVRANNPWSTYFQISTGNQWQSTQPGTRFTSGAFSPLLGLWHYIHGNGEPASLDITTVGLTFNRDNMPPVDEAIKMYGPGDYNISSDFGKSVAEDNIFVAALLGRISLKTEGQLRINESGSWSYNGVVRAYNDTYDANFDPSRGEIAQASTTVLSWFHGKSYEIALPGQIEVNLSGHR